MRAARTLTVLSSFLQVWATNVRCSFLVESFGLSQFYEIAAMSASVARSYRRLSPYVMFLAYAAFF